MIINSYMGDFFIFLTKICSKKSCIFYYLSILYYHFTFTVLLKPLFIDKSIRNKNFADAFIFHFLTMQISKHEFGMFKTDIFIEIGTLKVHDYNTFFLY